MFYNAFYHAFNPAVHPLRKDIIFAPPGLLLLVKWAKNMQKNTQYKFLQLPSLKNPWLCPVRAVKQLLRSRDRPSDSPLFVENLPPFFPIIDTKIRDALKSVLSHLNIPLQGHNFHAFRRSGAIAAFNNNVSIDSIKAHGNWKSEAIWTYLTSAPAAPPAVALAFQAYL